MGSISAHKLHNALRELLNIPVLVVSPHSKTYQPRWTDYVINWGGSKEWPWINRNDKKPFVDVTNKLFFFEQVTAWNKLFADRQVNIPEWTTDKAVAQEWYEKCQTVVARAILNGHSGKGISLHNGEYTDHNPYMIPVPDVPLYTKYIKKKHEYRVHFGQISEFKYKILDITQKKKRKGFLNVDTKIRNHHNGWVYAREDIYIPTGLETQAINAAMCSDLPVGAVDLIWNELQDKCYVLEVNSAPGIEGTTLQKYVDFFIEEINK